MHLSLAFIHSINICWAPLTSRDWQIKFKLCNLAYQILHNGSSDPSLLVQLHFLNFFCSLHLFRSPIWVTLWEDAFCVLCHLPLAHHGFLQQAQRIVPTAVEVSLKTPTPTTLYFYALGCFSSIPDGSFYSRQVIPGASTAGGNGNWLINAAGSCLWRACLRHILCIVAQGSSRGMTVGSQW